MKLNKSETIEKIVLIIVYGIGSIITIFAFASQN